MNYKIKLSKTLRQKMLSILLKIIHCGSGFYLDLIPLFRYRLFQLYILKFHRLTNDTCPPPTCVTKNQINQNLKVLPVQSF